VGGRQAGKAAAKASVFGERNAGETGLPIPHAGRDQQVPIYRATWVDRLRELDPCNPERLKQEGRKARRSTPGL